MTRIVLRGGRVIDPSQGVDRIDDVLVRDGQVVAIGHSGALPIGKADETIDADGLARLVDDDRIAFTYANNPNGSMGDIAGVLSENRRVLGMMPHPERATEAALGTPDGKPMFAALMRGMALA